MNIFFILMVISMLAVAATLVIGLAAMIKGGDFNTKYGNKLMRLRVILQGVALACMAAAIMASRG